VLPHPHPLPDGGSVACHFPLNDTYQEAAHV